MAKSYDSVFDDYNTDDFETIFDYDDSLVDTVNGCNEAGEPLTGTDFDELHQTEDDDDSDIEDEFGPDHDNRFGATKPEGAQDDYDEEDFRYGSYKKSSEADSFLAGGIQHTKESTDLDNMLGHNIDDVLGEGGDCSDCDDEDLDESYFYEGSSSDDEDDDTDDLDESFGYSDDLDAYFNEGEEEDMLEDEDDYLGEYADESDANPPDLAYETSDEDLINMAMGNN